MAADYRYMPDPDLPVLHLEADLVDRWRAELPMLPAQKQALYEADGVAADAAHQIAYDVRAGRLFEATRAAWSGPASMIAAWLTSEVAGALRARDVDPTTLSPESSDFARRFADLLRLVHEGTISATVGKDLLVDVIGGADAVTLVDERGLAKVSDEGALAAVVDEVMRSLPDVVASARVTPKAVNALLGRVMKETGGTADAAVVRRLIQERL
jgi:aspartyl-tRNA(Asn)/glutamyl-tRNA(Gln) amidotransferase subunit B